MLVDECICLDPHSRRSQTRQGPLASAPAATFAFIPSKTFMSAEQQQAWKDSAVAAAENASSGLKKQYETQIQLFFDQSSPEAEYVPSLRQLLLN